MSLIALQRLFSLYSRALGPCVASLRSSACPRKVLQFPPLLLQFQIFLKFSFVNHMQIHCVYLKFFVKEVFQRESQLLVVLRVFRLQLLTFLAPVLLISWVIVNFVELTIVASPHVAIFTSNRRKYPNA